MLTLFASDGEPRPPVTRLQALATGRYGELFRHLLDRDIYVAPSQYECLFPSLAHGVERDRRDDRGGRRAARVTGAGG